MPARTTTTLSAPLSLAGGRRTVRNRMMLAPLTNGQSLPDGSLSEDEINWLVARARGRMGMVATAAAFVSAEGKAWKGQLGVHDDAMLPPLERLADGLRNAGALSIVQLHHGGKRTDPAVSGFGRVSAWASDDVEALSTGEVSRVVDRFVAAAGRVERAGVDGVQVHAAHGYLIAQFLDGRHNRRRDQWGGEALENRARLLMAILNGIRQTTGPDFVVGVRLSPERFGMRMHEMSTLTTALVDAGLVDVLDFSLWDVRKDPEEAEFDGPLIDRVLEFPHGDIPVFVAGKILSAADAQWCLDRGADGVSLGSAGILHHDFADRALAEPDFAARQRPVSRQYLRNEYLGPAFIDHLADDWNYWVQD